MSTLTPEETEHLDLFKKLVAYQSSFIGCEMIGMQVSTLRAVVGITERLTSRVAVLETELLSMPPTPEWLMQKFGSPLMSSGNLFGWLHGLFYHLDTDNVVVGGVECKTRAAVLDALKTSNA